tara:strand:- start:194 stop:325 length:132 start_codon:yes stop_codon:yes gene_type:complete
MQDVPEGAATVRATQNPPTLPKPSEPSLEGMQSQAKKELTKKF